jgi:hypothetical protein
VYPEIRAPAESDEELFNQCALNFVDSYQIVAKSMTNFILAQPDWNRKGPPTSGFEDV